MTLEHDHKVCTLPTPSAELIEVSWGIIQWLDRQPVVRRHIRTTPARIWGAIPVEEHQWSAACLHEGDGSAQVIGHSRHRRIAHHLSERSAALFHDNNGETARHLASPSQ